MELGNRCWECRKDRNNFGEEWYYTKHIRVEEFMDTRTTRKYYCVLCENCYNNLSEKEKSFWQRLNKGFL